jgi:hypothetical protein
MARADFIVAKPGEVFALEMNTTPGMSYDSNFITAAGLCGLRAADAVAAILHEALTRPRYDAPLPVPAFTARPGRESAHRARRPGRMVRPGLRHGRAADDPAGLRPARAAADRAGSARRPGRSNPDIIFRDPSSWGQTCDRVPLSRLAASYTGRCITFAPLLTPATEGA